MASSSTVNINKSTLHNPTININQQGGSSSGPPLKKIKLEGFKHCLPETEVIGREEEANKLLELVQTHRRVVITGMGGIGKTSLAAHCARTWSPTFITNAIFIDAETNETVKSAFNSLGLELNIQNFEKFEQRVQVDAIYETFNDIATLVIFDNVTYFSIINGYLPPKGKHNLYVIITAQLREFGKTEVYDMPLMSKQSSLELMKVKFEDYWHHIKHEREEIETLIKKMQRHPLAIIQAVAHITDQLMYEDSEYTVQKYLDEFEERFNNIEFRDYWEDVYRYKSVYTALVMNMMMVKKDKIFGDKAEIVLHCMAYLDPSEIKKDMFLYLCDSKDEIFKAVIRLLRKYSLISINTERIKEYITIHRLVQHTSQCMLKEQDETRNLVLRNTLKLLINSYSVPIHEYFILPHMKDFKLSDFDECYSKVYSSGPRREELTEALRRVNSEFSAVEGWTAAHYAAFEEDRKMLELLKERGQSFSVVSQQNWTILHAKFINMFNHDVNLDHIIELEKSNLDIQTRDLNTALHSMLMKKVCDDVSPKAYYGCYQCTCALKLINSGCDITLTNKNGDTAAHLAARYHHIRILERLLESPGIDIRQKNNEGRSVSTLAQESHVVIYRHTSQMSADVRVWYRFISLKPLETQQAGVTLLKSLIEDEGDVYDGVFQDIVQLLDNIPLALRLAAGYMRHRNISSTIFKQHLTTLPADIVPSSVKNSCFGYRPTNICVMFCDVVNNLIKEHECAFKPLSYMSYINCCVHANSLFELTGHRHFTGDTDASIEILDMLSLWNDAPFYRIHELLRCVTATYSQMRGEERVVCASIITSNDTHLSLNGKAPAVRALGVSGVLSVYMERYGSAPAAIQAEIDRDTGGVRVLDVGDLHQWSALHWAAYKNDYSVVEELLRLGVSVYPSTDNRVTPLHMAALCGDTEIIKLLCDHGARVDVRTAGDGFTPLHLAACISDTQNTKKLLSRGADVNVTDNEGRTPAHMAVLCGRSQALELLRETSAAIDSPRDQMLQDTICDISSRTITLMEVDDPETSDQMSE